MRISCTLCTCLLAPPPPLLTPPPHPSPPIPPPHLRQGFHQESLEQARVQLQTVLPLLLGRAASVGLAALDDGIDAWLSAALVDHHHPTQAEPGVDGGADTGNGSGDGIGHSASSSGGGGGGGSGGNGGSSDAPCLPRSPSSPPPGPTPPPSSSTPSLGTGTGAVKPGGNVETTPTLHPSVRCGIEMALVHLVARASGMSIGVAFSAASGFPCLGEIAINGLTARGERGGSRRRGEVRVMLFYFYFFQALASMVFYVPGMYHSVPRCKFFYIRY